MMEDSKEEMPDIHLPDPSYWPIVLAFGLVLIAVGIVFSGYISLVGVLVLLAALVGWTLENRSVPASAEAPHE